MVQDYGSPTTAFRIARSRRRSAVTIIELLVVLTILTLVSAILLPAVLQGRAEAHMATCKNHSRQLALGLIQLQGTRRSLPVWDVDGTTGGWSVAVLPFVDGLLSTKIGAGIPLDSAMITDTMRCRPSFMTCPLARDVVSSNGIESSHYFLGPSGDRTAWYVSDVSIEFEVPWLVGPETTGGYRTGPHFGGFHRTRNDGTIEFISRQD